MAVLFAGDHIRTWQMKEKTICVQLFTMYMNR